MIPYEGADSHFDLSGKVALITGAAAGIGYATAKFFRDKGVRLVLADLNPKAEQIAAAWAGDAVAVVGDVCDEGYPERAIAAGVQAFGRIDILVNCAGIVALERAEALSRSDWDRTVSINLSASFFMAQAVGRYMIEHQVPGSIVNMASQAGVIALDRHVAYCASKGAINAMTRVMALEWGRYGIRVNAVSPTVVLTELGHQAWDGPVGDAFKREMPSERFAEPDEIAACIAFLCSRGAAMVTGHNLLVDGGFTIK